MTLNLMTGTQTGLILLDFSKAFGKDIHLKLLNKLKMRGSDDTNLNCIQSFHIGRTVVLEVKSSEELSVTSVVPQGSILEPILFLLYINYIQSQVRSFTDDTAVYLAVGVQNNPHQLQNALDLLQKMREAMGHGI